MNGTGNPALRTGAGFFGKAGCQDGKEERMRNIRLIAADLDGTLLTTDKRLTEANRAALERAAEEGIWIVPATGRIYAGIPEEIKALPFIRYLILANGAAVYDRTEGRMLYSAEIIPETALEVAAWLDGFPEVIYDCYQDDQGYMTAEMWEKADRYAPSPVYLQMIRTLRRPVPDLKEHIRMRNRPVQKMQAFCETAEAQARVLEKTAARFPGLAVTSSVARNVEINEAQANKGAALAALCACLGIGTDEAAAFGDGSNDVSMIRTAGTGVAMRNGVREAIEAAVRIAPGNDEDGVGRTIMSLLAGE